MNLCSICNGKFATSDLLQSNQDEYFCKECFKYEYCTTKRQPTEKKKAIVRNKCEGDSHLIKPKKMFTLAQLSTIKRDRVRKEGFFHSKRPLQCPHVDCNKHVSVVDLNAHFQHEHMDVRIVQTSLDSRNPLTFSPKDVRYGVNQCLILLNVVVPPTEARGDDATTAISQSEKPPSVTVAVLASRLASAQLGTSESPEDSIIIGDEDQTAVMLSSNDKIIIWTASNVVSNYSYTVAVSTVNEDIRVKYYGPLLQIGHTANDLCLEGHCLTLSHFHFLGMSENGTKPLNLDVIVHSED